MTRRDRIELLLRHYRVVCEGIPGIAEPDDEDLIALMCAEWNDPAYQQLEAQLALMARTMPALRAALRQRYERYSERRVAWCRRCGEHPAKDIGRVHSRCLVKGRTVALVPRIVRVWTSNPPRETAAIDWLEAHWRGDAVVPVAILQFEDGIMWAPKAYRALSEAAA